MKLLRQSRFCRVIGIVALTLVLIGVDAVSQTNPNFGANVLIFDPSMSDATIQSNLDVIFARQSRNEFGTDWFGAVTR